MRAIPFLLTLGILAACAQFPELDATATPGVDNAAYPEILPIGQLIAGPVPRATPQMRDGVVGRAAALRARAARLQGPIIDRATRARMSVGIARP